MATPLTSSTSALNVSSSAAEIIIERVGNGVVAFSSLFIPLQTATQSLGPTTATPTQNAPSDTDVSNSSKLNGGAIAAILFAIIATIATIATGAWIHWKRKKRMQSLDISDDHSDNMADEKGIIKIKTPKKPHYVRARDSKMQWGTSNVEKEIPRDSIVEDDQMTLVNGVYVLNLTPRLK